MAEPIHIAALEEETLPVQVTQTVTKDTTTLVHDSTVSWLHSQVRNVILLIITGVVCYLALTGVSEARSALIVTFTGLASYLFAERAALKTPGKDT